MSRLTAAQIQSWFDHVHGLMDGHPAERVRDTATGEYVELVPAWPGLRVMLAQLARTGADTIVDGYPSSSLGGGSRRSSDDDGEPLPPHSDPTLRAVVERERGTGYDKTLGRALNEIVGGVRAFERAQSLVMQLQRPHEAPKLVDKIWCTWHTKYGMAEPVGEHGRRGLCRACYEFEDSEGVKPPKVLLELRAQGKRWTEQMVVEALRRPKKQRARSRGGS